MRLYLAHLRSARLLPRAEATSTTRPSMQYSRFSIPGPVLVTPTRHGDGRGWFAETFRLREFREEVADVTFVQDNMSLSADAGTVRGLHYQSQPHAQGKLVGVVRGAVMDVAVDARRGSPTYGRHVAVELSAETGAQLWVPEGFLHGFATLAPDTMVAYKVTDVYAPDCDGNVAWDDPDLAIDWGVDAAAATLSDRDRAAPRWSEWKSPFAMEDAA